MSSDTNVKSDDSVITRNGHGEISEMQNNTTDIDKWMEFVSSVFLKLKTDGHYRNNYITSVSLLWSFVILGWIIGQIGPTLLDLQIITNTSIEKGSLFFTMHAFGYLIGSLITGIIYDKLTLDKYLLLLCALVGDAVILIALPWCSMYELMMFVHILKGILSGGLDTCGNGHLVCIWDGKCRTILQALHFSYSLGAMFSPYALAPFLATETNVDAGLSGASNNYSTIGYINYTELEFNSSYNLQSNLQANITDVLNSSFMNEYVQKAIPSDSRLYIAYSITAGCALSAAVPFLLIFMKSRCQKEIRNKEKTVNGTSCHDHEFPMINKVFFFIIISVFMAVFVAIVDSFNSYLAAFCVKQMNWSKTDGATITSVYWASQTAGKFTGMFIIKRCTPSHIIVTLSMWSSVCLVGLMCSAIFEYGVGIWMSSAGVGLSASVIFATAFTWTHEEVMRVNGKVTSLFMITAATGAVLNPIVLGPLMDKYSPMWFPYIMLGESIVQVLSFLAAMFVVRKHSSPVEALNEIDIHGQTNPTFLDEHLQRKPLSVRL